MPIRSQILLQELIDILVVGDVPSDRAAQLINTALIWDQTPDPDRWEILYHEGDAVTDDDVNYLINLAYPKGDLPLLEDDICYSGVYQSYA